MQNIKEILKGIHQGEVNRYKEGDIPRILVRMQKNLLNREELIKLIGKRYQLAHMFEGFLEHIMKVVTISDLPKNTKDALYQAVFQNYQEEKGFVGQYGGPHSEGREVLLEALGYNYQEWKRFLGTYEKLHDVCEPVKLLLEKIKTIVSKGPTEAVTALWYYENRISLDGKLGDYYILVSAFEYAFPEFKKNHMEDYREGDVLWHLASHAHHDTYHAELALNGLSALPQTKETEDKIRSVCAEMREGFDSFWEAIYE